MSLAAVAVRNQRRRAAQQQHQLVDDLLTQNASDPNLKLRKVRQQFLKSGPVHLFSLSKSNHGAGVTSWFLRLSLN